MPENRDIFPGLTPRQNLILGLKPGQKDGQGRWSLENMFEMFSNLRERADVEASVLSGGEQQRVAIARALAHDPSLILADEPTGNLDFRTAETVMDILQRLVHDERRTMLIATHDRDIIRLADRVLELQGGQLKDVTPAAQDIADAAEGTSSVG